MKRGSLSAVLISMMVHLMALAAMAMIKTTLLDEPEEMTVETVFTDERVQQEFSQELEVETEVAETMNAVSGGVVSTTTGAASAPTVSKANIETSESLQDPDLEVRVADISVPGEGLLNEDLGMGEVIGETGAAVPGYGAALSRMTQELIRMMREDKVLAVWLFDRSDSMRDDQREIRDKFHKVYEELKLAQRQDDNLRRTDEVLWTSITAYGKEIQELTKPGKPTADIGEIRAAIDKITVDESGLENTCAAIAAVVDKYGPLARRQKRQLAVIVVSDESGDDGEFVEETIAKCKAMNAPVYIMGRESAFGYPFARVRWKDPMYGLTHWLPVNRGPETAFPECLQWDGLHGWHRFFSAGFGPYEQVRIAKETGGIFFVLPGEEEKLVTAGAQEDREFRFLDMKQYEPLLLPRRTYAQSRNSSRFRKTIWDVIVRLNPNKHKQLPAYDKNLNIRDHWYPIDHQEFAKDAQPQVQKAAAAMALLNQAVPMLEGVKELRATEDSERWRANFDLILAQCYAYRVRLFQFLLAMDNHFSKKPIPKDKKSNVWNIARTREMHEPDEAQFERVRKFFKLDKDITREQYLASLKQDADTARRMYQAVLEEHPGTPWAQRAQYELKWGFGMQFREGYRNPNYTKTRDIKLPKQ